MDAMIADMGRLQGKKYVRLEYSDKPNKWLIVSDAEQLFQLVRKSCIGWKKLSTRQSSVCFGINNPNDPFVCKIFDHQLADQFEKLGIGKVVKAKSVEK